MRHVALTKTIKGAGACAALFIFVSLVAMPVAFSVLSSRVEARMATEGLTIQPAAGGAPIGFDVEVAATDQQKAVGLMFRTKLAERQGMLFPYGDARIITMWMRNTYIPLDMVFIRANGVIQRIEAETTPFSEDVISSEAPVSAVLEIAGGAGAGLGI